MVCRQSLCDYLSYYLRITSVINVYSDYWYVIVVSRMLVVAEVCPYLRRLPYRFLERIGSFFVWWILWKSMVDSELSSWCTRTKSASLENTPRRLEVQETLLWLLCRGTVLWSSVASGLFGKMAVGILAWTPATSFVIEVFVVFLSPCRQCQNIALNWATPHLLPVLSNLLFTDALIMAVLRTAWDFDGVAK